MQQEQPTLVIVQARWGPSSSQPEVHTIRAPHAMIMPNFRSVVVNRLKHCANLDAVLGAIKEQPVLDATKAMLHHISSGQLADLDLNGFLSSFLIAYWPIMLTEHHAGAVEREVIASANALVRLFDGEEEVDRSAFRTALRAYSRSFSVWRRADRPRLIQRLQRALLMLSFQEPGGVLSAEAMRETMERVRSKLLQHMGADALRDFEEQIARHQRRRRGAEDNEEEPTQKKAARLV